MEAQRQPLEDQLATLEARIAQLEQERKELLDRNGELYEYCRLMDRKYTASVRRELGYQEMLYMFNNRHACELLQDYIAKESLKVQYSSQYNYRTN
jgi:hypothetical protein